MILSRPKVTLPIVGVILFAGFAGCFLYQLFINNDDEDNKKKVKKQNEILLSKIEIPYRTVGAVIGRNGATIKLIQDKTETKIDFKETDNDKITCIIEGKLEKIEEAKMLILKNVEDFLVIKHLEMKVPNFALGKIIKKNGEVSISQKTGTNIRIIDSKAFSGGNSSLIVINGSENQINEAESMIIETIEEEEKRLDQIRESATMMAQRNNANYSPAINEGISLDESCNINEVFVTAVENAAHFWFQIKGNDMVKLNKLVEEMTFYYNEKTNREIHKLNAIKIDDVVAARFPHDSKWYRGNICKHEEDDDPSKYVVYFVDFGDTDEVDPEDICELRTDYLQLKFQAVEAYLANIDLASCLSDEATLLFESLVYLNRSKSIKLKILEYQPDQLQIPYVQLMNKEDIDVAEELIKKGLGKPSLGS